MARAIDGDKLLEQLQKKKAGPANKRYTEGFNDCLMRVRSMVHSMPTITPPNEWVSVEERLPEVDDSVLVYIIDTFNNRGNIVITKYTIGLNSKMEWLGFEYNSFKATHWMPLPAPPDRRTTEVEEDT